MTKRWLAKRVEKLCRPWEGGIWYLAWTTTLLVCFSWFFLGTLHRCFLVRIYWSQWWGRGLVQAMWMSPVAVPLPSWKPTHEARLKIKYLKIGWFLNNNIFKLARYKQAWGATPKTSACAHALQKGQRLGSHSFFPKYWRSCSEQERRRHLRFRNLILNFSNSKKNKLSGYLGNFWR